MKRVHIKAVVPIMLLPLCMAYNIQKNVSGPAPEPLIVRQDGVGYKVAVESLLVGAYSQLDGSHTADGVINAAGSNWLFGSVAAGDAYKSTTTINGNNDATAISDFTFAASNPCIQQKYATCFNGVVRANDVLRIIPLAKDLSASEASRIMGEARFLRGYYYFELKKMYNMVPYINEASTDTNQPNDRDIWPNIEADLQAGIDNIPVLQQQKGRANKWVAVAYLAKAKMFQHKFAEAKALFKDLITNGLKPNGEHFALNDNMQKNFSPDATQKNSVESVFAAQAAINENSGDSNSDTGGNHNSQYNSGADWFSPSQSLGNSYKTDAKTGLPLFTTFNDGKKVSDKTDPYTGTIDPRIDITMGRPDIPYLDWNKQAANGARDQADGVFSPRKNVYSLSEKGSNSSTENYWAANEVTSNNINLMRWSDVLLMAAEAEVEAGDVNKALNYVNQVRRRAANPTWWVYKKSKYDASKSEYVNKNIKADNYLVKEYPEGAFNDKNYARMAIRFERKLELGMEGQRFFDLQRWDQGTGSMAAEINAFFAYDIKVNPQLDGAHFTKDKNEYYAIPQNAIDLSGVNGASKIKQNPGY